MTIVRTSIGARIPDRISGVPSNREPLAHAGLGAPGRGCAISQHSGQMSRDIVDTPSPEVFGGARSLRSGRDGPGRTEFQGRRSGRTGFPRAGSQRSSPATGAGGYEALAQRSKTPLSVPRRTADEFEDKIVLLRKELAEQGLDAGAHTIHYHLVP